MDNNYPTDETMNEGSDLPPQPADIEPAGNIDCVPLDALAMPDEKEQLTPPAVGDEVTYTVTGKVTAVTGGMATVERTSINGNSVDDNDGDTEPTEDSLRSEAGNIDGNLGAQ